MVARNPAEIDMFMTNKTVLNFNKIISFQSTRKKKMNITILHFFLNFQLKYKIAAKKNQNISVEHK